jgi:hypothetical protein
MTILTNPRQLLFLFVTVRLMVISLVQWNACTYKQEKNPVKYTHIRPSKCCVLSKDTVIPEYGKDHLIRIKPSRFSQHFLLAHN